MSGSITNFGLSGYFTDPTSGLDIRLVSGAMWSGSAITPYLTSCPEFHIDRTCRKCGIGYGYTTGDQIDVGGVSGLYERWCWRCAGYEYQKGGFFPLLPMLRSDWKAETPVEIIADWFIDHNMPGMAEYLRIRCSGVQL